MKKLLFTYLTLSLLLITATQAQHQHKLDTQVTRMLAQMPMNDLNTLNKTMEEAISYGAPFIAQVAETTVPPGTGDDTAARYILNGLARYASGLQSNEARALIEQEYIKAIDKKSNKALKAFFIHQLSLIGHEATVSKMAEFMRDERLCEPATQTLLTIGGSDAENIILEALVNASAGNKVTLVKALGELKMDKANGSIMALEGSTNPNLQVVVLSALASIGHPDAYPILLKAAQKVAYEYEPTGAANVWVKYAQQLGENGYLKQCEDACSEIIASNTQAHLLHNRLAAFHTYTQFHPQKALSLMLKEINNTDPAYRVAILALVQEHGNEKTIKKSIRIAKSAHSDVQADIIDMLGAKKEVSAIPFIQSSLTSSSDEVRKAALTALAQIQKADAAPAIVQHMVAGKDTEHATSILLYLIGKEQLAPVADALDHTQGASKAALIHIIAAKSGDQYSDKLFELVKDKDERVKTAALSALVSTVKEKDIDHMITILTQVDSKNVALAQKAVINAVLHTNGSEQAIAKVLTAMDKSNQKERFVAILPCIGGQEACAKTSDLFYKSVGTTKDAAFKALAQWEGNTTSDFLYQLCKSGPQKYRAEAFNAFVKQTENAQITSDNRLLALRKAMDIAQTDSERISVLAALKEVKTYPALKFVEKFIDNISLQADASTTIMHIALPNNKTKTGLFGEDVHQLLERILPLLSGPESDYYKINVRNYIKAMKKENGYVAMFNGKDLSGWKGLVGNPITRAKMSRSKLAQQQKEANKKMRDNWSVQDGNIVFSGTGANLCSDKEYADFELIADWRITKHGDSGIYLRGTPQVQVWDTSRVDVGAQVGSGGLYNNQKHESKPLLVADNPVGEWNTFRIIMIKDKVTVYLNGLLVVDHVVMENYWDRSQPIFPKGNIELQAHGTNLGFRDIYIREITDKEL